MVASATGFHPLLEVHLDTLTVTSSLNDMRLLIAQSCRVRHASSILCILLTTARYSGPLSVAHPAEVEWRASMDVFGLATAHTALPAEGPHQHAD